MASNRAHRARNLPARFLATVSLAVVFLGASTAAARPKRDALAANRLHDLAARAARKSGWPGLRRYAESAKDPEQRGLAYFTLGYREYEADEYSRAATDLGRAASIQFSLADLASIYQAQAAQAAQEPEQVVKALEDFATRYPHSIFHQRALALLAEALLEIKQPERAIEALTADPKTERRAALALLLAKAYEQAQKLAEAANVFEHVHYGFPLAPESDAAGAALKQLKPQLGDRFPAPAEQTESHRAEALFNASRYSDALKAYDTLLEAHSASPLAGDWRVSRAKCLVHLKRLREAVDALPAAIAASPETDAGRLAALVDAYARLDDPASMLIVLDQLSKVYPQSPSYRSSLFRAGTFFVARGDWATAARYYQPLADSSPMTDQGREANWRLAWTYYLESDDDKALQAFGDHLKRYPDSPHVPAALYWLGRLAEKRGRFSEAQAFFQSLEKRFVDGYYTLEASLQARSEAAGSARRAPSLPLSSTEGAVRVDPAEPSLNLPPRTPAPVELCAAMKPAPSLAPAVTLTALSLNDLAELYLKNLVSDDPNPAGALTALTRLEAQQGEYSEALFSAKRLVPNYFEYEFTELPKEVWQWLYPRAYWNIVERQARANRLDPYLVMALSRQESAFNPKATSVANARGLMQMRPNTATTGVGRRRRRSVAQKLYDPAYNVSVACRYLRELLQAFHGNVEEALAAYNAGDFRVNDWLKQRTFREPAEFVESIPFRETRLYVESVLRDQAVYRKLITGSARFMRCD